MISQPMKTQISVKKTLSGVPQAASRPGLHTQPARWPVLPTELLTLVRGCHRNTHCKDTQGPQGLRLRHRRAEENKTQERELTAEVKGRSPWTRESIHTLTSGTQIRNGVPWMYKKGVQIMFLLLKLLWRQSVLTVKINLLELSQRSSQPLSQDHNNRTLQNWEANTNIAK